jgi:hypothetical protein
MECRNCGVTPQLVIVFYDDETDSYFFDRNPIIFQSILDFYRDGQMHIPHDVCARQIGKDLIFWQLSLSKLADCCKKHYKDVLDEIESYEAIVDEVRGFPRSQFHRRKMDSSRQDQLI